MSIKALFLPINYFSLFRLKWNIMRKRNVFVRIYYFYLEGFRSMTLGKTLWAIILIKLFVLFIILKIFFFPNFLKKYETKEEKQEYVGNELINRAMPQNK